MNRRDFITSPPVSRPLIVTALAIFMSAFVGVCLLTLRSIHAGDLNEMLILVFGLSLGFGSLSWIRRANVGAPLNRSAVVRSLMRVGDSLLAAVIGAYTWKNYENGVDPWKIAIGCVGIVLSWFFTEMRRSSAPHS